MKTNDHHEFAVPSQNPLYGKRIFFVLFSFELGGAERQALYLARYLKNVHQAHVEVWAFCNPGRLIEICDEYQIKWKLVPVWSQFTGWQIIFSALRLGLALRAAKPDILLPYMTPANIYCGLAWRFTGAKCCIWNQRNAGHTIYNLDFEINTAHKVSALVANSELGADFMVSTYGVPKEKVHVIHNGVELSSPKTDKKRVRDYYKISEDDFIACMVANLNSNKDHITLLKAWALVTNRLERRACLLLAGRDDSAFTELKSLARELKIDESVIFLGPVREIPDLLQIVDLGILISPSQRGEGMSNAILEYMAAGLPVVSTDIASIRETVGEENFKYLMPLKDAEKLSEMILTFANNKKFRQDVGRKNREWAEKSFPLELMFYSYAELIISHLHV